MDKAVDQRDLLKVQVEVSEQLILESRSMMTAPFSRDARAKKLLGSLRTKDLILWGTRRIFF